MIHVFNSIFSTDLAYFDGLNETILSAALVKPKQGTHTMSVQFLIDIKMFPQKL